MKTLQFAHTAIALLLSGMALAIPHDGHTDPAATPSSTTLPTTAPYGLFYEVPQSLKSTSTQDTSGNECAPATTVTVTMQAPEYPAVTITNSYTVIIPTELASVSSSLPPYAVNGTGTAVGMGSSVVPTGGVKTTLDSSVVTVPLVTRTTFVDLPPSGAATSTREDEPLFTGAAGRVDGWDMRMGMLGAVVAVWGMS